jgi:hypothetical protein
MQRKSRTRLVSSAEIMTHADAVKNTHDAQAKQGSEKDRRMRC